MHLLGLISPAAMGQVEELARTFGVDWAHLGAQITSFAIVCALLYWLAYRPVLRMLEARRQQIALGLATSLAAGTKANFGTMTKPLHAGHAARNASSGMRPG